MKRRGPKSSPPATSPVVSARCAGAPAEVERNYEIDDRLLRTLFLAVCRTMNLEAYGDSRHPESVLFVTTTDAATQDQLERRFRALSQELDDALMALTTDFIRERCGIEVPIRPRS